MTPVRFPEATRFFGPSPDMTDEQVHVIHAYVGEVPRGSCEGAPIVITAWQPSEAELAALNAGGPVFLTFMGGLPPHFATTSFAEANNPA
jgi:hypothetical protein